MNLDEMVAQNTYVTLVIIGGGPAALYFASLKKKTDLAHEVLVVEPNRAEDNLQHRHAELGVRMEFQKEVTDLATYADADLILADDGVNGFIRSRYAERFRQQIR